MGIKCPKCQSNNPDTQQYCGECGTQLILLEEIPASPTKTLETPKEELTTGSTFAGRYQIIEELGKGGMGKVYKAHDTEIKEKVALKLLMPEIASDEKTIERFRNEIRLARKIVHKNVGRMYDLSKADGTYFITMEYVEGQDLRGLIRQSRQLTVGTTINIAKQVSEGLAEAHKLGVVHRDLKPSNVMIDKEGNARIMDFGIARSVKGKGITGAGVMIGTPEYMSPEQVEVKEVDQRSDIYSLGVILYEMVTGRVPFEGETPLGIAMKHKSEMPKDPREINAQIPEDLSRVILRCMEKDKNNRYQSAGDVRSELIRIDEGIPTTEKVVPKRKPITSREITVTFGMKKLFIPALVVVVLVIAAVVVWQLLPKEEPVSLPPGKPSIAVLPFDDLSPQKDQGYLCDGFAESIINALTKVEDLRVPARTSSFSFKGKEQDIQEIGEKLNVKTVLEGSVQKAGNRVRITVQLINVADESLVWSEQYNRELNDVFAIQDEITLAIIDKLKVKLLGEEKAKLVKRYTENLEAYNLYLRGRYFSNRQTEAGYKKSIEYFEKAINLEKTYALAYVGLAHCYKELSRVFSLSRNEGYPKAKEALMKALKLDETLGEAYAILASIMFVSDWNMSGPEEVFQRAIKFSPGSVNVYKLYAQYLTWTGKYDEAIAIAKRAVELDPLTPSNNWLDWAYFYANRYDESISQLKNVLDLDPNFVWAHVYLAHNYTMKGMYAEAIVHADKVESISLSVDDHLLLSTVGGDYARSGRQDKAQEILEKLLGLPKEKSVDPMIVAGIYAALGDKDKAFDWLTKAYEARSGLMVYLQAYGQTFLKDLSSDPRYIELLNKMGFEK
jgi:serine/threonine protein kinase/tetratricopeptide (TPR) repeat protein